MKKLLLLLLIIVFTRLNAQQKENTGWLFLNNSTKFSQHWGMHLDIQFRSADNLEYIRTAFIRPGVTYHFNKKNSVTAGYMLNNTYNRLTGASKNSLTEHRIWEQYLLTHKIKSVLVSHRFRLEQRFIERLSGPDVFSQRFRYFARFIIPLVKEETYTKGFFVALQNEVFLHLQNKEKLNNHFFDQNRAYVAAGYRFSQKLDLETGYLNQTTKGISSNTNNHVIQLAVYTRF